MVVIKLGSYHYHLSQRQLIDEHNQPCLLRQQSLQVLHELALHANEIRSKAQLFSAVWKEACVTDDSLVQCIKDIRHALHDQTHAILQTIPRRGYVLVARTLEPKQAVNELVPLLGRDQDLQQLEAMLLNPACRLITVLGMGGMGKSRLTKSLAKHVARHFPQGIVFVELAAVQCPELIAHAIAMALGLVIQGQRTPLEQVQRALTDQHALIILDNFEHLLPETGVCQTLLEACPQLKILTTSRMPLQVYGEWLYHLPGLSCTPLTGQVYECPAYEVFLQSARRVHYAFTPREAEQAVILEICRLVNGMPLGIEIAASWLKHLSCAEVLDELRKHLQAAQHTALPELATPLTQVVQQTWHMLSEREQQVMQMLALFRGTFKREVASNLTGASLADYGSLIDKSLLSRTPNGQYVLHEVMRQYASHLRVAEASHQPIARRFIEYYLELASTADTTILGGQQFASIRQLAEENDNFRECLRLCALEASPNPTLLPKLGLKLVGVLGMFWFLANHWQEGYRWSERFLTIHRHAQPSLAQGMAFLAAGGISAVLDNHTIADRYVSTGHELAMRLGGKLQTARGLLVLGVLRRLQSRCLESIECGQHSMQLFAELGDEGGYQFNLVNVGHALLRLQRYEEAVQAFEACIGLNQKIGLTMSMPYALINLGRVHSQLQEWDSARAYLQQALQIAEQLGVLLYRAQAWCLLGWLELEQGNAAQAFSFLQSSMVDYLHLGDKAGQIEVMKGIGVAQATQGELAQAWQCLVVAEDLAQHLKLPSVPDHQSLLSEAQLRIQHGLSQSEQALQRNLGLVNGLEAVYAKLQSKTLL